MAVLKVIDLIGVSPGGWEAAARAAVAEASRTVRHIENVEVVRWTAQVRGGEIHEYQALTRITFRVEGDEEPTLAVEAVETILSEPAGGDGEELPPFLERQIEDALEELDPEPRA